MLASMGHFYYARHFSWLGIGVVILFALSRSNFFAEPFLPTFAINGALHAAALAFNARQGRSLLHKLLFIGIATVLSVAALYVGMAGTQIFASLPAGMRSYEILISCAIFGARTFWLAAVPPRVIIGVAVLCAVAVSVALFARRFFFGLDAWWLTAAWWFAMSGGIWYVDTHLQVRSRR